MIRPVPRALALVLATTAFVLVPQTARAATSEVAFGQSGSDWVLSVAADTAANGHQLHVSGNATTWTIDEENYDQGARLPSSYPAECTHQVIDVGPGFGNEEELHCVFAQAVTRATVSTGDGNDQILYTPSGPTPGTLSGGKGNDFLLGGPGDDMLYGDNGSTDQPGDGQDTLDGGCGVDGYYGGGAIDVVSFQASQNSCASHQAGVTASLDDQADDGPENENIGGLTNSVEGIVGTSGDDDLSGNAADNYIMGVDGDDRIDGLGGPDELVGGAGDDVITGGPGHDKLYGDGPTADSGDGNDTLWADDGEPDTLVDCGGSNADSATVDAATIDATVVNCESVHRPAVTPPSPPSPPSQGTKPVNLVAPAAPTGAPHVGDALSSDDGTWSGSPTSYAGQWQRCRPDGACINIGGATSTSYTVGPGDENYLLRFAVTARNAAGATIAYSAFTGLVQPKSTDPATSDPTAVTEGASLVTSTSARLFADVSAHGTPAASYYWLVSPKFGTGQTQLPNPGLPLPADSAQHTVTLDIGKLQAGTTYLVRACVNTAGRATCGASREFTTTLPPAVVAAGVPAAATGTVSQALSGNGLAAVTVPVTPKASGQEMLATYALVRAGSALPTSSLATATTSAVRQVGSGAASLLPPASSLLPLGGGRLITNDGGSLITNDGGSLITNDGGSLITNDGGSIVASGGGNIVASGGGNRVTAPALSLRPKKPTRYLLVLVSYAKKTVVKGKRVVLKLHYTRTGARIMKAAHAHNRILRAHHKPPKRLGVLFDVEFRKHGSHKVVRSGRPVHSRAR